MRWFATIAIAACLAGAWGSVSAQGASGSFDVVVTLNGAAAAQAAPERCVSELQSLAPIAVVQVACLSASFVGIEPGTSFFGRRGGGERLGLRRELQPSFALFRDVVVQPGMGTVTALRILNAINPAQDPIEVLIVF